MASLPFGQRFKRPIVPQNAEMSLFAHLNELRQRLVKATLALLLATLVSFFFTTPILEYLQRPYGQAFVVLGPTGGVSAYFRVALMAGAAIALPLIIYQILMFILPALTGGEKRSVIMAIPGMGLLFLIGASFAWFVLIPPALGFLEGFQPTLFRAEWTADQYLGFVTALIFWIGVAFEMPLVFFILAWMGMIRAGTLIQNWRIAIVVSAAASAVITPTVDPVNMGLVMAPLLALYLISILLVVIGSRKRIVS